jgi:hypothetical protein
MPIIAAERKLRRREAAEKAIETKGPEELQRAGCMAAWTRKHGKNDAENPHSKQNCGDHRFSEAMAITVLAKSNPRRPGTKRYRIFELYQSSKTVGAFRQRAIAEGLVKNGYGYMNQDIRDGLIAITPVG